MAARAPRFVHKPWGHEEIFAETARYVGKILFIRAGEALSLQYHERKEETLRVLDGSLQLVTGLQVASLETLGLGPGEVFHIAPGVIHRMVAVTDCRLLEVSTPELDDVVRLEDRYGRTGTNQP
ncbi:MAG: cupin domain-containing protein [Gemmatimonadota bacterium]